MPTNGYKLNVQRQSTLQFRPLIFFKINRKELPILVHVNFRMYKIPLLFRSFACSSCHGRGRTTYQCAQNWSQASHTKDLWWYWKNRYWAQRPTFNRVEGRESYRQKLCFRFRLNLTRRCFKVTCSYTFFL